MENQGAAAAGKTGARSDGERRIEFYAHYPGAQPQGRLEHGPVPAAKIDEPVVGAHTQSLENGSNAASREPAPRRQHLGMPQAGHLGRPGHDEPGRRKKGHRIDARKRQARPAWGRHGAKRSAQVAKHGPGSGIAEYRRPLELRTGIMITEAPGHPGHSPVLVGWINRTATDGRPAWRAICERCGREVGRADRHEDAETELRRHRTECRPQVEIPQRGNPWWPSGGRAD